MKSSIVESCSLNIIFWQKKKTYSNDSFLFRMTDDAKLHITSYTLLTQNFSNFLTWTDWVHILKTWYVIEQRTSNTYVRRLQSYRLLTISRSNINWLYCFLNPWKKFSAFSKKNIFSYKGIQLLCLSRILKNVVYCLFVCT